MKLESIYKTTRSGLTVELRSPTEDDAQAMIDYLKKTCGETRFLLSEPEDVNYTLEGEREFLKNYEESENMLMLNAFVDGKLAGNASFSPVSQAKRLVHRASMGIAIFQEYWHMGIGKLLMETLIEYARNCGYEIMELGVMSTNENAIGLYKQFGFEECGTIRNAMKYKDGTYADEITMQLFL